MRESKTRSRNSEQDRLLKLAREYKARGYRVFVRPSEKNIPRFLQGLAPDLIARKGDKGVVVEVKSRASLRATHEVSKLARAVRPQRGWRFELVLTNPRTRASAQLQ